jgi:hypothetical protein
MSSAKQASPTELTEWLLEEDNPAVRYFTMTRLLDRPEKHPDVRKARSAIMTRGVVPRILARQHAEGYWDRPDRFYHAKYRGSVWQLIVLAEHGADPSDPRIRRAGEFILDRAQDRSSGGFALHEAVRTGGGRAREVLPCLTGNMVWSLLRLGFATDARVQRGVNWLAEYLRFDDGESKPPADFPYSHWEMCYGRHACFMGVVKGLKALAEVEPAARSAAVRRCIRNGVEFLLKHHVFKQSHDLRRVAKPGWRRFGFPRMWGTDVLDILLLLTRLGVHDSRMQEAFALVAAKQDADGRWLLEDTFNGRFLVPVETRGRPSKWLTLNALTVLRDARSQTPVLRGSGRVSTRRVKGRH